MQKQLTAKERYERYVKGQRPASLPLPRFKWLRPAPLHPVTQYKIG